MHKDALDAHRKKFPIIYESRVGYRSIGIGIEVIYGLGTANRG
jgi:hypothetical protein